MPGPLSVPLRVPAEYMWLLVLVREELTCGGVILCHIVVLSCTLLHGLQPPRLPDTCCVHGTPFDQ